MTWTLEWERFDDLRMYSVFGIIKKPGEVHTLHTYYVHFFRDPVENVLSYYFYHLKPGREPGIVNHVVAYKNQSNTYVLLYQVEHCW